jgi:hypothetical protein
MRKSITVLKICSIAVMMSAMSVASAGNMVKDGSGNPVMFMGMEKPMMADKMDKKMDHKMDKMEKKEMMDDKMDKKMMDKKKM